MEYIYINPIVGFSNVKIDRQKFHQYMTLLEMVGELTDSIRKEYFAGGDLVVGLRHVSIAMHEINTQPAVVQDIIKKKNIDQSTMKDFRQFLDWAHKGRGFHTYLNT